MRHLTTVHEREMARRDFWRRPSIDLRETERLVRAQVGKGAVVLVPILPR